MFYLAFITWFVNCGSVLCFWCRRILSIVKSFKK